MLEVFRSQAKVTALKKMEIRIAPKIRRDEIDIEFDKCKCGIQDQLCNQIYEILYVYRRYILENLIGVKNARNVLKIEETQRTSFSETWKSIRTSIQDRMNIHVPTIGIVFHFLKTELLDNTTGFFCWRKLKDNNGKYSNHGLMVRKHMENVAIAIEGLRGTISGLDEYIVGIDAASDENAMEPWMFAPAYIKMRSRIFTKPIKKQNGKSYRTIQNVGFTYHVGEDFRHIISGLRHIDEVVEQFHYKPGDRLGHAIALGINIDRWVMDNEVVAMPILEYMENLLWMWGKNVYDGINLPIQLENLEERIIKCAKKLYQNSESITIRMLYDAYKMKFRVDHWSIMDKMLEEMEREDRKECINCDQRSSTKMRTVCYYSGEKCSLDCLGWTSQKLMCTNYCPVFEEKYKKVILVTVPPDEIATYEYLQEYLLTKMERKGIYIETNPTSNVTIGDFSDFHEHPIFRMNSLKAKNERDHHVMVTINSDDPAVFNTNVENELAYIYYAMEHEGFAKEYVLNWIDKIRQNGLDASFIQTEKSSFQIMQEISGILDEIRIQTYKK